MSNWGQKSLCVYEEGGGGGVGVIGGSGGVIGGWGCGSGVVWSLCVYVALQQD